MTEIDWNSEAQRALRLTKRMMEAHRGAFVWHGPTKTVVLFGNDGSPLEQLAILTLRCKVYRIEVLATAIDEGDGDPYSFAMLVECDDPEKMTDWLWESWWDVKGFNPSNATDWVHMHAFESCQRPVAADCIAQHFAGLEHTAYQPR